VLDALCSTVVPAIDREGRADDVTVYSCASCGRAISVTRD
jgi:hypothetical protein